MLIFIKCSQNVHKTTIFIWKSSTSTSTAIQLEQPFLVGSQIQENCSEVKLILHELFEFFLSLNSSGCFSKILALTIYRGQTFW